eukprot:1861359-Rhodomonas_salina.1
MRRRQRGGEERGGSPQGRGREGEGGRGREGNGERKKGGRKDGRQGGREGGRKKKTRELGDSAADEGRPVDDASHVLVDELEGEEEAHEDRLRYRSVRRRC